MFKKSQKQSTGENGKKPFSQKVRDVVHTAFWLGGSSYKDINNEIDQVVKASQKFRKEVGESRKELYKDFAKK